MHTHRWQLRWCLAVGIHDCEGWMPVLVCLRCACGVGGVWSGEENTRLQQRRLHAGERNV